MRARIGVATAAEVPDLDDEGRLFLTALQDRGLAAEPAVWDADLDWASYDLVVVRSTWDYAERLSEFLAWADRVSAATRLLNSAEVLHWNTDKRYLADLERAGVPIVPTQFLAPGEGPHHRFEHVEHVVKPVVSAGSRGTLRLGPDEVERSHAHAATLLDAGRGVMVQPYLHEVDEHGETALLYVDGRFSHAMRKGPLLTPGMSLTEELFLQEEMSPRDASNAERELADAILEAVPAALHGDLLYARVDLLPSPEGPRLLELELAEPSLFLDHHPPAAGALADAVVRRLS
ncbi:ATP-grasp domain-containing protein [Nocardioides sp.]|uniref:ATP-grasp domain-containing protein n=1 Tax=Nocardioides sp. TaxID=35761 RepID=UPI002ED4AC00